MNDLKNAFHQFLKNPGFTAHPAKPSCRGGRAVAVLTLALGIGANTTVFAHPGSGIVVDRREQIYFVDTGQGIWKIDVSGRVSSHEGPAYHWMTIDHDDRLARTRWPGFQEPSTEIHRVGVNPTLLIASDFPLTTGRDGSLYYPGLGKDDLLRVFRLTPAGERSVLAILPSAIDGQPLKWLNGMATGPNDAIYFSENAAVRLITPQGEVLTVASNIAVSGCLPLPGASHRLGPFLRGLDVASDGTVYVAANGCGALLKITARGEVTPVLRTTSPWSPTGVAVSGDAVFVLEYLHTASGDRREWTPRVRKLSRGGDVKVLARIERAGDGTSRVGLAQATGPFIGSKAGDVIEVGGLKLCWCPPGRFQMGSPSGEAGRRADEAQVEVTLSKGFWAGKYEVTQGQWKREMGAIPGELIAGEGDDFPVYWVSFIEAEEYCRRLTERARASGELPVGWEFRLPTEAQWEYACRAGTTTPFSFGESLTKTQANFGKPYDGTPDGTPGAAAVRVGTYAANSWGLHDMHGNEFEWCRDWYHPRLPGGIDPDLGEIQGTPNRDGTYSRVRRGGAWTDDPKFCRSALRLRYEPPRRADHIGFRVVVVETGPQRPTGK